MATQTVITVRIRLSYQSTTFAGSRLPVEQVIAGDAF
jgi:hypothetical protein